MLYNSAKWACFKWSLFQSSCSRQEMRMSSHCQLFIWKYFLFYIFFFSWYIWPVQGTKDYKILVCNVVHYWNVHSDIYSHFWSFKWIGYPLIHEEYNLEMHTWVFPLSVEKQPNIGNNIITLKHIFVDIWLIKRRSIQK